MSPDNKEMFQNQLLGHQDFLNQFCIAKQKNNLHHAYLLHGSIGIGKSFLARQLAAYLLEDNEQVRLPENSSRLSEAEYALSLNHNNSVWRQIFYQSHPDMVYLSSRKTEQNKSGQIKVDDIKSIKGITNHSSGRGGWRIIIIDSLDKTNRNGANSILKILEEPPDKTIFFLISHNVSRVIPTIRSRCQQVKLEPLHKNETRLILENHIHDISEEKLDNLVHLCEGSPGMAILIYESGVEEYFQELNTELRQSKTGLENIIKLATKWGSEVSKNPEGYSSTNFIFDKLFSEAALVAVNGNSHNSYLKETIPTAISNMVITLAQNYTAEELTNLHQYWQSEFHAVQTNFLDMGNFLQQTFYKIYSQIHAR